VIRVEMDDKGAKFFWASTQLGDASGGPVDVEKVIRVEMDETGAKKFVGLVLNQVTLLEDRPYAARPLRGPSSIIRRTRVRRFKKASLAIHHRGWRDDNATDLERCSISRVDNLTRRARPSVGSHETV